VENNKSDSSSPSSAPTADYANDSAKHGGLQLPAWSRGGIFIALVALASVGYFTSAIFHKSAPVVTGTIETDPQEIANRKNLPDFILTDADGKQKKLSDYRGNVVILSFWASWCGACLVELPTFAEIEKRLGDQGLRIIAVNVDEGDEGKTFAKDFWGKKKFAFPSFFDGQKALAQQFDVEMLPSNFVIDRQGRLAFSGFGANDWSNPQTVEFLEGLLQEKTGEPAAATAAPPAGG